MIDPCWAMIKCTKLSEKTSAMRFFANHISYSSLCVFVILHLILLGIVLWFGSDRTVDGCIATPVIEPAAVAVSTVPTVTTVAPITTTSQGRYRTQVTLCIADSAALLSVYLFGKSSDADFARGCCECGECGSVAKRQRDCTHRALFQQPAPTTTGVVNSGDSGCTLPITCPSPSNDPGNSGEFYYNGVAGPIFANSPSTGCL